MDIQDLVNKISAELNKSIPTLDCKKMLGTNMRISTGTLNAKKLNNSEESYNELRDIRSKLIRTVEFIDLLLGTEKTEINMDHVRKAKADYMREYMKKWREKNPEKVKESQQRYWSKKHKKKHLTH